MLITVFENSQKASRAAQNALATTGLPDAFCKNTGHFVTSDNLGCIRKRILQWHWIPEKH